MVGSRYGVGGRASSDEQVERGDDISSDDQGDEAALSNTFAERNAEMKLENGRLKNQIQALTDEIEPLRADLHRSNHEVRRLTGDLEEERAAVVTLTEERQAAKAEATKEVGDLREQLEGLRSVLEAERAVELQKLRSELDFAKAQVENKHWKSEKADLVAQVDDLNAQLRAAKKEAATAAAVPEGHPGLSVDPAQVEKMLAETATEIRHLQSEVEHWKREAAKASEAAEAAVAAGSASAGPQAVTSEADTRSAAELSAVQEQLRAQESYLEEQDALQKEQVAALQKVHAAEVAKLNKQVMGLREKLSVQQAQPPQLTPSKGVKKMGGSGAGSAADPLLREQQKLKKQLSDLRRELAAKKDETRRLEDEITSMKGDAAKTRKARAAEKKRWQDDQDLLREQVESMQSQDSDMRAMIEAIEAQARSVSADVALWQERAASEQEAKEKLQSYLDELRSAGRADDAVQGRPPLCELVEEAVTTALQRGDHSLGGGENSADAEPRHRLVNSLAKTEVMARRLKAMAAEVEASVSQPLQSSAEEEQERSPHRYGRAGYASSR
jgi:chromosome segregation ATPase